MESSQTRLNQSLVRVVIGAALVTVGVVPVAYGGGTGGTAAQGTLPLRAVIDMTSVGAPCPPEAPTDVECYLRQGTGAVSGLGSVSETYFYFARIGCVPGGYSVRASNARLAVAGKGTIEISLDASAECLPVGHYGLSRTFTVNGGTGAYAGASGGGTLTHEGNQTPRGVTGRDTWVGNLVVPGREFDVTPPALTGATGKTVRVRSGQKRVRVSYRLSAVDEVDGVVPVGCRPASGSWFKIGRTVVRCSATDTSANTATATFTVLVKAAGNRRR